MFVSIGARLAKWRSFRSAPMPDDVYFSQIDALHADERALVVGAFGSFVACAFISWVAASGVLAAIALAMPVVVAVRLYWILRYHQARPEIATRRAMRRWELRYVVGSTAHVACFGAGGLAVFLVTDDAFCRFAWSVASILYFSGIPGRNFATGPLVTVQLMVGFAPFGVAMAIVGGPYALLLPGFLTSILGFHVMAARLRNLLLDAVLSSRENAQIAARFNAALTNMPHGLWMFDADGKLIVSNGAGPRILKAGPRSEASTILDVFEGLTQSGRFTRTDVQRLVDAFDARRRTGETQTIALDTSDERYLSFTIHGLDDGGAIVLLEDMTARRKAESAIHDLARFDPLTRLMNRSFFEATLNEGLERLGWRNESLALLFIDLDHFKAVNDTLGHQCGDALLRAVATRLRDVARETDFVARFGGDEFVLLQTRVRSPRQTQRLAQRITAAMAAPFDVEGQSLTIGASVGMALAPRDGRDVETLMRNADMALYNAKSAGRGCARFFERAMDLELQEKRVLVEDVRAIVAAGTFEVHYQPIYASRTRMLAGAEALLRCSHPVRGPISPLKFVPVMEELGLIVDVGRIVLERACRECATWPERLTVAVNLSAHQFKRGDLVEDVRNALRASKLDPRRLVLEITESTFLERGPETIATLDALRAMGARIALDDFGTGYSSLSYLHQFPIDKLKIDRSFLRGIETDARSLTLMRNVAQLSHNLGLSVVAEGIETESQMALAVAEGTVDEVQGFLFSKPVAAPLMRAIIDAEAGVRRAS